MVKRKKKNSIKQRTTTPRPSSSRKKSVIKDDADISGVSNNCSRMLYQLLFYTVLLSVVANYFGKLELLSHGYVKTEWLKLPVVLSVPVLVLCVLILFNLIKLASATEQRMTGGQYLNREPISREDFEKYGLGTLSNKATPKDLYLDVLKHV